MKEVSAQIAAEIHDKAESDATLVDVYVEHVWQGQDPRKFPGGLTWWSNPVNPFCQRINNAYRESVGLAPIPVPPSSTIAYSLFAKMLPGQWLNSDDLKPILHNQRITSFLSPSMLRKHGYEVQSEKQGSRVHYRLTWIGQS